MPRTHTEKATPPSMACFARLKSLIEKAGPGTQSPLSAVLETLWAKENETQKVHDALVRTQARRQERLKKLKDEIDAAQRQLDDLTRAAEAECDKIKPIIYMQKNFNDHLQGIKCKCIICREDFELPHTISCPVCNHQTCFQCFDRLDDRIYTTKTKQKKCGNCRHVLATVEVPLGRPDDDDDFGFGDSSNDYYFSDDSSSNDDSTIRDSPNVQLVIPASPLYSPHDHDPKDRVPDTTIVLD